ncbi:MAG TPA: hypothetical protein VHS96_09115 [Bacteroidia bacterium]|nr:hypothetical protein [Bacteroidia bacterium]
MVSFSKTSEEVLPKIMAQLKPISQLISELNLAITRDNSILEGINKEHYSEFRQLASALTRVAESLAELDFFQSKALKELVYETMHQCYGVEAEIKLKAYENQPIKKSDDHLKRALSANGMKAVHKRI